MEKEQILAASTLSNSKTRMMPCVRRLKTKHNVIFRHTHLHELIHYFALGIVALKPNFAPFDVKVKHHSENETLALPTDANYLKTVALTVSNQTCFYVWEIDRL